MIISAEQRVADFLTGKSHTVPDPEDANKFLKRIMFGEGISHLGEDCPWILPGPDYVSRWSQVVDVGKELAEKMKEPPAIEPSQLVALYGIGINLQILGDRVLLGEDGTSPYVENII